MAINPPRNPNLNIEIIAEITITAYMIMAMILPVELPDFLSGVTTFS